MTTKTTRNPNPRSVSTRSRRLRLEVLEDRRLLSAVAFNSGEDPSSSISETYSGSLEHDYLENCCVAIDPPACVVPEVPQGVLENDSATIASVNSTLTDQVFEVNAEVNANVIFGISAFTSRVKTESELNIALYSSSVSEIIIDSSYNGSSFSLTQLQLSRTLSITSEKAGFSFTGNSQYPMFWIKSGGDLTLFNITISGPSHAIYNEAGTITIQNCTITSCSTGISNAGTARIQNCTITSGTTGIYNTGTATVSQVLCHDVSDAHFFSAGGTSTLYHCTFNGTGYSTVYGNEGNVKLYNSIVTGNTTEKTIYFPGGTLNGSGNIVNHGVSASGSCSYVTATPEFESDYFLKTTSAGFESVKSTTYCLDVDGNQLTTDLYGNNRRSGTYTDAGAVERQITVESLPTPTNVTITVDSSNANKLNVTWNSVKNAVSYKVKYQVSHPECETSSWLEASVTSGTSWSVTLIANATLSVQIIACGNYTFYSNSYPSDLVSRTTASLTLNETTLVNGTSVNVLHLHSNPEATRKIYLDFTGHMTYDTDWNSFSDFNCSPIIISSIFNLEGSTNQFSESELLAIYNIWESVAEDYAPFDVDVTTEFPGMENLKRTSDSDVNYGIRAVIGKIACSSGEFGGVAYPYTYDSESDIPCFILPENLHTSGPIAEATSHEVGHTLGLYHRGGGSYSLLEYSYGVKISNGKYVAASGRSDTYVWCPIMGASYYAAMTQWSDGSYYNAQWHGSGTDVGDLETINTYLAYKNDDYGNYSTGTITGTPGTLVVAADGSISVLGEVMLEDSDFTYSGIITSQNDSDVFVLTLENDHATIDLHIEGSTFANLDIYAALYSSSDLTTALLESNEFDSLNAELSLSDLAAGTYYLVIDGVGKYGSNGLEYYSDYGSLGYYSIYGTLTYPNQLEKPELQFSDVTTSSMTVSWQEIENAVGYRVQIGDANFTTSSTEYALVGLEAGTNYTISVTALAPEDSLLYISSTGIAKQATLQAPVPAALSMVYGNTLPTLTFTGGWQSGDVVKYSLTPDGGYSTTAPDFSTQNVGEYTLYLAVERDGLEIWTGSTSVTVTPRVINASEITWTNDVTTYNGSEQTVSATFGNVVLTVTPERTFRESGTYTASVQSSDSNYALAADAQTHTLTMNKYTISSVSWSVPALTYTGSVQDSKVSASFMFNGSATALNFTTCGDDASSVVPLLNAGDYTLRAELIDSSNFQWASTVTNRATSATIAKYAVTLKDSDWEPTRSFVYDGQTHSIAATFKDLADSTTNILTVSSTEKNVGSYTLTATLGTDYAANYTLSGQTTQTVSITPKSVAVSFAGLNGPYTYTAQDQRASISASAVGVGADVIPIALSFVNQTDSTTEFKTAGTYTVTATTTNTNYALTNATAETVMQKRSIETLAWTNAEGWTYDGASHVVTATFTDQEGKQQTVASESFTDAGSYTVAAQLSETLSANYEFSQTLAQSRTVTVAQREVSEITWSTTEFTYDGTTHAVTASFKDVTDADHPLTVTVNDEKTFVNAGNYTVSATMNDSNYVFAQDCETTADVTIHPHVVTDEQVTWDGITGLVYDGTLKTASASFTFNEQEYELEITVYGDDASSVVELKNAGEYTLTAALKEADAQNFALNLTPKTVTIAKAKVLADQVTWGTTTLEYTGNAQTVSAWFGTTPLTVTYDREMVNVGEYTASVSLTDPNYEITDSITHAVSITPFQIESIDWGETELTYNLEERTLSPTFDFNGVTTSLTYTVAGGKTLKNAGEYTLQAVLPDAQNFEFADGSQTVGVSIAKFTVNAIDWPTYADLTYTGEVQTVARPTFQLNGQTINLNVEYSNEAGSEAPLKDAGTYTVTASLADSANCEFGGGAVLTSTVKINPFTITQVTWTDPADLTFTATEKTVSAQFLDCDGQTKDLTVITEDSGKTFLNAGEYAFTAAVPSANYVFQEGVNRHAVTIQQAEISALDWTIDSEAWNGTDHLTYTGQTRTVGAGVTFVGVKYEVAVVCGDDAPSVVNAGNYEFTASLTGTEAEQNFRLAESAMTKNLTIDRKTLDVQTEIQWSETQFVYDTRPHTVSASFTDLKTGEPAALNVTYGDDASNVINVGTYALTATLTEEQAKNYVLSAAATNTAQVTEFEISEIVWTVPDLVYSGTTKTISAQFRDCDGELKPFAAELVTETTGQTFRNVGDYVFQLAVPGSNYKFAQGAETTKAVSVTPFIIGSITWDGWENLTYDGKAHTVTASFTDALGASQFLTVYGGDASSVVNAGTYTMTAALGDWAANYAFASDLVLTKDVTVAPREVSEITWSERVLTYTGAEQAVTASFKDVTDADHFLTVTVNDGKTLLNADSYSVSAAMNDSNYVFATELETTTDLTINPYVVTDEQVTWDGITGLVYDGTIKTASASFAFNEQKYELDITISGTGSELRNAGEYTLTAALKEADVRNFTLDLTPKSVAIAKAKIMAADVTWSETEFSYNAQPHEVTASAFGVDLMVTPNATIQNAGDYTLSASLNHPNYELGEEITRAAKVTPFQIGTIDWGTTTLTYSDEQPEQTLNPTFLNWNSEPVSLTYVVSDGKTLSDAGTYTVAANLPADAQNYEFSAGNTAQITINPLKRTTPASLSVVGTTQGTVRVTWISDDFDFTLEYGLKEDFSEATTLNPEDCEVLISGLTTGETYYFRVRANHVDENHLDSDFTEPVSQEIRPISLQGVLIAGTVDEESESTSTEGVPENSSTFYSWDPVTVEVWTESVQQVTAGNKVQMSIAVDPTKYELDESSVQSLEGVTLEVKSGIGEFLLEFTINETWSADPTPVTTGTIVTDEAPATTEAIDAENIYEINALRLGAITFKPIYGQSESSESGTSLPILIDGEPPVVTPSVTRVCYDLVEDGKINISDLVAFAKQFGRESSEPGVNIAGDFDYSGKVDINDLVWFARNFGLSSTQSESLRFPEPVQTTPQSVQAVNVHSTKKEEMEITDVHTTLNEQIRFDS